jgi:hypothetical protein
MCLKVYVYVVIKLFNTQRVVFTRLGMKIKRMSLKITLLRVKITLVLVVSRMD